jgi:hypothetical protein
MIGTQVTTLCGTIAGDRSSLTEQLVRSQIKIVKSQTIRKIRNSSWKEKKNQVVRWLMVVADLPVSLSDRKFSSARARHLEKSGIAPDKKKLGGTATGGQNENF